MKAAWNTPLPLDANGRPTAALHPSSASIITKVNSWTGSYPLSTTIADTTADFNHPVFFAKSTDPLFTVAQGASGGAFESGGPFSIRIPQNARPARGGDGHMCVIQPDGVTEYDLWDVTTNVGSTTRLTALPAGGGTIYARGLGKTRLDGTGLNTGNGDATAAKFGLLAGVFRGEEIANQDINHALWWTMKGHNNTFVAPALATGGAGGFDSSTAPPMGARFFLDYSQAEVEALSIPRYRKTITHAMRKYGAIFGDAGGSPIDLQPLSGTTYTALGLPDTFKTYMTSQGVTGTVDWRTGVDYAGKLRVAAASVSQGWPFPAVAQPTRPTGTTPQNGGVYDETPPIFSNREYITVTSGSEVHSSIKASNTSSATIDVNNVIVRNSTLSYVEIQNGTNNLWMENCVIGTGSTITIFNVQNQAGIFSAGAKNVVIDGCTIKDAVRTSEATHIEGCHVTCVNVLWIKNCTFRNNSLYNISLQTWGAGSVRYVLIENCVFEPCHQGAPEDHDQHSIVVWDNPQLDAPRDIVIRNNTVKVHDIYLDQSLRSLAGYNLQAYNNRNESGVLLPDQIIT